MISILLLCCLCYFWTSFLDFWKCVGDQQFPALKVAANLGQTISIPLPYLSNSGLCCTNNHLLVLYCRQSTVDQFEYLKTIVHNSSNGFISGPPGSGKSSTSFAFAMTLDRTKYVVTWVHLGKILQSAVQFRDQHKFIHQKPYFSSSAGPPIIGSICRTDGAQKNIIFIDGFDNKYQDLERLLTTTTAFPSGSILIFVSSLGGHYKVRVNDMEEANMKPFKVYSWTLQEYISCVKDKDILNNVRLMLDSSSDEDMASSSDVGATWGTCWQQHWRTW